MSKKRDKYDRKRQHWVAESYLRAWCDKKALNLTPYVWRVSKDGQTIKPKSPKKTFCENELYTLKKSDGTRDLKLESLLAFIEHEFAIIRQQKIYPSAALTADDVGIVKWFMAAQQCRTPQFRDHWSKQLGKAADFGREMTAKIAAMSPEERKNLSKISAPSEGRGIPLDEMIKAAERPLLTIAPITMQTLFTIFDRMNLSIFHVEDDVGFITSDAPCVSFDVEWYKAPVMLRRGVALRSPTVEVSMPLSPAHIAVISHRADYPGITKVPDSLKDTFLDEYNRRTRFHCHKEFVVNSKVIKGIWFDRGKVPPGYEDIIEDQ
ncbi:MAG: DUF4238 domain-containing protein [Rhodospirillaceae bacterium]|nr:DUF4238 domain-containing protein [Rhodospirillaceae bacterium]